MVFCRCPGVRSPCHGGQWRQQAYASAAALGRRRASASIITIGSFRQDRTFSGSDMNGQLWSTADLQALSRLPASDAQVDTSSSSRSITARWPLVPASLTSQLQWACVSVSRTITLPSARCHVCEVPPLARTRRVISSFSRSAAVMLRSVPVGGYASIPSPRCESSIGFEHRLQAGKGASAGSIGHPPLRLNGRPLTPSGRPKAARP
jgi:hypothetical protein